MTRPVVWTRSAQADFKNIIRHLAAEAPDFAQRIGERIVTAAERLGTAATGRPGRVSSYYEKSLPDIHYIIAYSFDRRDPNGDLNIVRIIHSSRDWPADRWPD